MFYKHLGWRNAGRVLKNSNPMENLTIDEILTLRELLNEFLLQAEITEHSNEIIGGNVQIMVSDMPNVRSILQKVKTRISTPSVVS